MLRARFPKAAVSIVPYTEEQLENPCTGASGFDQQREDSTN